MQSPKLNLLGQPKPRRRMSYTNGVHLNTSRLFKRRDVCRNVAANAKDKEASKKTRLADSS